MVGAGMLSTLVLHCLPPPGRWLESIEAIFSYFAKYTPCCCMCDE
jgi:hypothetical protein